MLTYRILILIIRKCDYDTLKYISSSNKYMKKAIQYAYQNILLKELIPQANMMKHINSYYRCHECQQIKSDVKEMTYSLEMTQNHRTICLCIDCLYRYYIYCQDCGSLRHVLKDDIHQDRLGNQFCAFNCEPIKCYHCNESLHRRNFCKFIDFYICNSCMREKGFIQKLS